MDDIAQQEFVKVQTLLKDILSGKLRIADREEKEFVLDTIDEFSRCYRIKDNRQSKYYCIMAYDRLVNLGYINDEE